MYNFKEIPLDDQKTWDLISSGRTIGLFQLESQLGQSWAKKLKPKNIEELSDLISLIRPSCLEGGMTDLYCKIKNEEEEPKYLHEALRPILEQTKSCLIYQEQSMKIGIEIAGFTEVESDKYIRKGIGKKLPEVIAECKKIFTTKAAEKGLVNKEEAEEIFSWLEKAQRYQFNKCLSPYTIVETKDGCKTLLELQKGDFVRCPKNINNGWTKVLDIVDNGFQNTVELTFSDNKKIECTINHKFLCHDNIIRPISEIISSTDRISLINDNDEFIEIYNLKILGMNSTFNIEVDNERHLYYSNGIIGVNSHAVGYGITSYLTAFQKANFPTEFYTAWLTHSCNKPNPKEEIYNLVQDARLNDITVFPPDIRVKNTEFTILKPSNIIFGLSHIRGVGSAAIEKISNEGNNLDTFNGFILSSKKLKRNICEALIKSGACDCYGLSRSFMLRCIHVLYGQTDKTTEDSNALAKPLTAKELGSFFESFKNNNFISSLEQIIENNKCVKKRVPTIESKINSISNENIKDTNTQKSIWEKLYLGLNLTCSAADDVDCVDSQETSCKEVLLSDSDNEVHCIHVVIDKLRIKETGPNAKNPGVKYAYLDVSDNSGAISPVIIWARLYEEIKDFIHEGNVVTIYLKKNTWKDRTQFICDDIRIIG
jgi:DNA polymerase III alpha subunit